MQKNEKLGKRFLVKPGVYGHQSVMGSTILDIIEGDEVESFLIETIDWRECQQKYGMDSNEDTAELPYQTAVYHLVDRKALPDKLSQLKEANVAPGCYVNVAEGFLYHKRAADLDSAVIVHDETVDALKKGDLILMPPALSLAFKGKH